MTAVLPPVEGTLSELSLPDLLSGHAQARSSGRLLIKTSVGEAHITLWEGGVAEARFGPADGEAALLRLLSFTEGTFVFEARAQSVAGGGASGLADLLAKAQQHQAEVVHHAEKLGGIKERFALDLAQLSKLDAEIRRDIGPVLGLIDGRRNVQEVVAVSEMPDVTVLRVLRKLRGMGLLKTVAEQDAERRAREAPPAAPVTPAPAKEPLSLEEMLLAQAAEREAERTAVLEAALPDAMRSAPPPPASTPAEREARTAAAEAFAASEPAVTAPPERKRTPPAGVPVAVASDPVAPPPAKPPRDEIKLKKPTQPDPPKPVVARWTDRPPPRVEEPTGGDDGLEYALDRRSSPVAPSTAPAESHPTPLVTVRVESSAPAPVVSAPAPSAVLQAPPATPAVQHDVHDDAFFDRGADRSQLEALAEESAAGERDEANRKLLLYVVGGVAAVMVGLLVLIAFSGTDKEPVAQLAPVEVPQKPAVPHVVIPEMGAEVRTQQDLARELVKQDTAEPHSDAAVPKSAAVLAAELAADPPRAAEKPAEVPPVEKPLEPAVVEKAPERVVEKQVEKPVVVAEKPRPVEKPAVVEKAPEDPKRLFNDRFDRGSKLLDQQRYEDAKKAFESALKFNPGSAPAYTLLGRVNYELGNLDEALRLLRKSEALDQSHAYTYLVMGLALQERGDVAGADRAYTKYLTLDHTGDNARSVKRLLEGLRKQGAAKKGG